MTDPYVVCVGLATLDSVFAVPTHPGPDDRVVATAHAVAGGGPSATAAVTLARLGVQTYFVGVVGGDSAGWTIRGGLEREGVDVSELLTVDGTTSPQSSILVGAGARAIIHFPGSVPPLELSERARDLCVGAAWVHVDHAGYPAVRDLRRDVRLSIDGGNPIPGLALDGVALYAPTENQLHRLFSARGVEAAVDAGAEMVVMTRGERGSVAVTRGGERIEARGYEVDARSTLGAGDVFHGALVAALMRDLALPDALAFANRAAALSCRGLDGRSSIPTLEEVESSAA